MLEQEIASAIKFILDSADNPAPYYYEVSQDFIVPAVYFPQPEIDSRGDTLLTYALEYSWFIKFFHKDAQSAQALAFAALTAIQFQRNRIPLIDEDGKLTGRSFLVKDPLLKSISDAAQLTLMWDSARPYYNKEYPVVQMFNASLYTKSAFDKAVSQIDDD